MTVPAERRDSVVASAPAARSSLIANVMFRSDEDAMIAEAMAKYEKDQREMVSLTAQLCGELQHVRDEDKRHSVFRDTHAKAMREHYAKTGHLMK